MLGREKFQGGIKDGELYAAPGETYLGGQPAALNTSGDLVLCTSGLADRYVGVFANDYDTDGVTASSRAKATIYSGHNVLKLMASPGGYPYNDGLIWDEGDLVYQGADGKWTNSQPGSVSAAGIVQEVGSNYLVVRFK